MHTLPLIFPAIVWFAVLLWLSTRAVVDGAVITVRRRRRTAVVNYRDKSRVMRFAAEIGPCLPSQQAFLRVAVPQRIYTTEGDAVPEAEVDVILSRLSRGLSSLDMAFEFYSPEVKDTLACGGGGC